MVEHVHINGDDYLEEHDVMIDMPSIDVRSIVRKAADATSPGISLIFLVTFAALAYFHESHMSYTFIGIGVWIIIQFAGRVLDEDVVVENGWWWALWGLVGDILFYLIIGLVWTYPKLY